MNNTLEEISSWMTEAEILRSDLEDRMVEITFIKQNIEEIMRNEDSLRDLWDIMCTNICITGIPSEEKS